MPRPVPFFAKHHELSDEALKMLRCSKLVHPVAWLGWQSSSRAG